MPKYLDLEAHTTVNVSELLGGVKPPPPKETDTPDESEADNEPHHKAS